MSFYIIPKTLKNTYHIAATWPLDLTMSGKVLLKQEVFNYMCEYTRIKHPCIHLIDSRSVGLTKFMHTWNICDESVPGGFEIEAMLDFDTNPEEEIKEVLKPLIKKYQERFDD